jgi:hypothetical protein
LRLVKCRADRIHVQRTDPRAELSGRGMQRTDDLFAGACGLIDCLRHQLSREVVVPFGQRDVELHGGPLVELRGATNPQTAAHAMVGLHAGYQRLPYFFSDQYDLDMEYTGHVEPGGYDQVVLRRDVQGREFLAFWLNQGRVLAGMNVNVWDVTTTIESIILAGRPVDTVKLGDPDAPLESLV